MDNQPPTFVVAAFASLLRHGLTALGAVLETYADFDVGDPAVTRAVTALVGLAPILASLAWSWVEKNQKLKTLAALVEQNTAVKAPAP